MKKAAVALAGIWVINSFLMMAYIVNRPLYNVLVDGGVKMYSCIDWDEEGRVIPGVCSEAMPEGVF